MFVFDGGGETTGPRVITAAEYFEKLVVEFVRSIRARREGIFEIDLALRPYGKAGSLAVSLDSFRRYFAPGGRPGATSGRRWSSCARSPATRAWATRSSRCATATSTPAARSTWPRCGPCASGNCATW